VPLPRAADSTVPPRVSLGGGRRCPPRSDPFTTKPLGLPLQTSQ
jgi:hypothetical protein